MLLIELNLYWTQSMFDAYDVLLKIIILCIWFNRICWLASNVQKTHYLSNTVHYIILGPLCPASLKRFLQSPSFRQPQSALIGQLTQSIVIGRTPEARVGTVTPISIITSFSFQNKCKDS